MRSLSTVPLLLAAVLFAAAPAVAQDSHGRSRVPPSTSSGGSGGGGGGERQAAPRDSSPPPSTAPAPNGDSSSPRTAERRAVPRVGRTPNPGNRGSGRYYYPPAFYPYGYGAFGLGYFYYDPYLWGPYGGYGSPYGYGAPYPGYAVSDYDTGEVRLKVKPRDGEVYVNGYYAGRVDDFDGYFQALRLQQGNYRISVTAPGYEPLDFNVHVTVDHKVTYEGELLKKKP